VYVVTDDEAGGRMAAAYLAERGFTRVGGIFKSDDMQGHLRYQGFSGELQDRGLRVRDDAVCWFITENKRRFLRDETGAEFIRKGEHGAAGEIDVQDGHVDGPAGLQVHAPLIEGGAGADGVGTEALQGFKKICDDEIVVLEDQDTPSPQDVSGLHFSAPH
jgi:hypothetical protein